MCYNKFALNLSINQQGGSYVSDIHHALIRVSLTTHSFIYIYSI